MGRQQELLQHMDLQRPEAAAEIDLLTRRDVLPAKHHDVMVEVRLMNAGEIRVIDRQAQIQPVISAPRRAKGVMVNGCEATGVALSVVVIDVSFIVAGDQLPGFSQASLKK